MRNKMMDWANRNMGLSGEQICMALGLVVEITSYGIWELHAVDTYPVRKARTAK